MAKSVKSKYPRTVYKSPGTQRFVSKRVAYTYDSLVVNNETELDAAEEMGYIDSFYDVIFHPPKKVKEEPKEEDDALREGF